MTEREIIKALIENAPNTYSGNIELQQKKMFAFQNAVKEAQKYLEEPKEEFTPRQKFAYDHCCYNCTRKDTHDLFSCGSSEFCKWNTPIEKHYIPFSFNCGLIAYCGTKNIWVKSKFDNNCVLQITGYTVDDEGKHCVWLTDSWITLEKLFDDWLFLDDSPIGLEE